MQTIIKFFLHKRLVVNLLTIFIIIVGSIIAYQMRRTAFPDVDMGMVTIDTIYEGATALEVEQLVTDELEDAIEDIDGIKKFFSTSSQNLSHIFIEIEADEDTDKVLDDIKAEINNVNDLPEEAEDPEIKELDQSDRSLLEVAIWGADELTLRSYADILEERIKKIDGISKIDKGGYRDREIHVEVNLIKLEENRLTISDVANSIEASALNIPSGSIDGTEKEILIRTIGETKNASAVENIFLRVNDAGKAIMVKDIATVFDTFEDPLMTYRANGHPAIDLQIKMKKSGDAIDSNKDILNVLTQFQKEHSDVNYTYGEDLAFFVKRRLTVLKGNGILGIIFVLILLLLFLNWRIALCTALGIPVAFLGSFFILDGLDMSINMLSMLGLIIVLGMLVDDAIVVAENIYQKLEAGMDKKEATLQGTLEVIAPVTGTIITTMAAFLPLILMGGIMGKFLRVVPIVVISALFVSWLESMLILPVHISDMTSSKKLKPKRFNWFLKFQTFYGKVLEKCLGRRYLILLSLIMLLIGSIMLMKSQINKFEMFPKQLIDTLFMRIEATEGTSREAMTEIIKKVEAELLEEMNKAVIIANNGEKIPNEIKSIIITHGSSKESGLDPFGGQGDEYAFGRIELTSQKIREQKDLRMAEEIINTFKEKTTSIAGIKDITFATHKPGPPQGKSLEIQIKGKNFNDIAFVSTKIEAYLNSIPEIKTSNKQTGETKKIKVIHEIKNEIIEEKDEISVIVDKKRAAEAQLNTKQIASAIRIAFTGKTASSVNLNGEEIDINVRLNKSARSLQTTLDSIKITNAQGIRVPLSSLATINHTRGLTAINHRDGERVAYITGEIENKYITPVALVSMIKKVLTPEIPRKDSEKTVPEIAGEVIFPLADPIKIPNGITIAYGGEMDMAAESVASLKKVTIAALLLIFFILAVTFNSIRLPLLVMAAIPFGAIGIILAFYAHGEPYSFLGIIGAIGMTGVVVNDSIVLVDFIKRKRENGMDPLQSILDGGRERLRPVILTSVTTLGGLAPTAYQIGTGDPFLVPIALAIGWGLAFATMLTLIAIPCLYLIMDDILGPFPKKLDKPNEK